GQARAVLRARCRPAARSPWRSRGRRRGKAQACRLERRALQCRPAVPSVPPHAWASRKSPLLARSAESNEETFRCEARCQDLRPLESCLHEDTRSTPILAFATPRHVRCDRTGRATDPHGCARVFAESSFQGGDSWTTT